VARCVDQIELVPLTVLVLVAHAHGRGLDRDAALAFKVHRVQHLVLHLAVGHGLGQFQQAIGQRRLAMIDMRDDAEVADVVLIQSCSPKSETAGGNTDGCQDSARRNQVVWRAGEGTRTPDIQLGKLTFYH
jgi:hypothetical protein